MDNMGIIKALSRNFSLNDPDKLGFHKDRYISCGNRSYNISFNKHGTFRVGTKTKSHLIQWRSACWGVDEFVLVTFGRGSQSLHVEIGDLFENTMDPERDEMQVFEMIYPEVYGHIHLFRDFIYHYDGAT